MKTLETNHGGNWLDKLLNAWPLCLDADYTPSLVAIAWDADGVYFPGGKSLYYNGFVFVRLTFPFGLWLHLRFARNHRSQFGVGWKLNGRFGITFRPWHSDESAAAGAHAGAPNVGQAAGWARGTA